MKQAVAAALLLFTVGCGDDRIDGTSPTDFSLAFAREWCALLERCCVDSSGTVIGNCEAAVQRQVSSRAMEASADGARFDAAAVDRCLEAIGAASCDVDAISRRELLRTCEVWVGTIPPGGECTSSEGCQDAPGARGSCVGGQCLLLFQLPPGEPCSGAMACDPLLAECVDEPAPATCVEKPGEGQPCTDDCRAGFRCGGAGACEALAVAGAACAADADCRSDTCTSTGVCAGLFEDDYCALP